MNGKFLLTILGSILAVLTLTRSENNIIENWWGGGFGYNVSSSAAVVNKEGQATSLSGNYFNAPAAMMGSGQFVSTPQFSAMISPRFNPNPYGSFIKYNTPDQKNLAVPKHPLDFGNMAANKSTTMQDNGPNGPNGPNGVYGMSNKMGVKENYGDDNQTGLRCRDGQNVNANMNNDYALPSGYHNGNYMDAYNKLTYNGEEAPVVSTPCSDAYSNMLPIGTMSAMDSMGNEEQVVVVNDLHVVPMKSRKVQGADFIRGDLPIVPCQNNGWFNVPVDVSTDLRAGAMQVLNGDGESNAKLMELLVTASGGARSAFGGSDLKQQNTNLSNNIRSYLSQGQNTVEVSAFP